jgi:high-affinity iron transporter
LETITHMPSLRVALIKPALALVASLMLLLIPAAATADPGDVQTAWRLLDYMAVDYGGAVANRALPATPERQSLIQRASQLQGVIARKGSAQQVAALAYGLAADLLKAYL